MMVKLSIPVRIFDHTVEEVMGVLGGIKYGLRRASRREFDPEEVGAFNRETVEHLLERDVTPGDIEELMSDLDERLRRLGVVSEPTPAVRRGLSLNERRFEEVLTEAGYTKDPQKAKDVRSLTAIHRLRDGRPIQELSSAPAVFLTSNPILVKASRKFFATEGHSSRVPQCISDISFTTQLWLRRPEAGSQVPRKLLMAESYAALRPSPELWSRYLRKIEKRRDQGDIDDRQVKVLVLSNAGREGLLEVTGGDPDAIDDETPMEVLNRYEQVVTRSAAEDRDAAIHGREELRAENERLRGEAADLRSRNATQGEQLDQLSAEFRQHVDEVHERDRRRQGRARLVRSGAGIAGSLLAIAATAVLVGSSLVSDPAVTTAYVVLGVATAVSAIGFGLNQPFSWIWRAIVAVGVVVGIIAGVYQFAATSDEPAAPPKSAKR
jgi:predicted nucleic acid-binding protein